VATPVSHRLPTPGDSEPPKLTRLKLYQAVHGNHYLVAATLVCRMPGLPEHDVDASAGERVSFVLRRLDASGAEWAWVDDPAANAGKSWLRVDPGQTGAVATDEELLPMFPLRYTSGDRLRRLFVGLVPTSSIDTFKAAGELSPLGEIGTASGGPPADPRVAALSAKVTDTLRALMAAHDDELAHPPANPDIASAMNAAQTDASRFLLLDFADFLHANLGWFDADPQGAKQLALWNTLATPAVAGGGLSWRDALTRAWSERHVLMGDVPGTSTLTLNLKTPGLAPDALDQAVNAALGDYTPPAGQAVSIQGDVVDPPAVPKLDPAEGVAYAIRCVYRRPQCPGLHPDTVSAPTEPFSLASFFDFDAPARSITITMPAGTGIKDLRKVRKSVNLVLSSELRNQMNRVASLKDALDGNFASGETVDLGLICSFSIPIITICALIVLMIFISLLNIVFWWMPFLRICFPIPTTRGGGE
jgi:hypothetical protein